MPRKKTAISDKLEYLSISDDKGRLDKKLEPHIYEDVLLRLHRTMLLGHKFDVRLVNLQRQGRIRKVGITGRGMEGVISEGALAIEMGALAEDMAISIHPHPTLSETEGEAAELYLGSITHILSKKIKS
jgi:TPP-dependent pyruvate/acetoin dehydrogenase alpha subunit